MHHDLFGYADSIGRDRTDIVDEGVRALESERIDNSR